ncbi:hypothetical protein B5X24_HaOG207772 [Helicoverpa armigera]|nr:hypothetical protein B5X24_HaOG207772 [Helicoverpa armigera]
MCKHASETFLEFVCDRVNIQERSNAEEPSPERKLTYVRNYLVTFKSAVWRRRTIFANKTWFSCTGVSRPIDRQILMPWIDSFDYTDCVDFTIGRWCRLMIDR